MTKSAVLALLVAALAVLPALPARAESRARQAEKLVAAARRHLEVETFDSRRAAIHALEEATRLVSTEPEWHLLLARTYMRAGYQGLARARFDRVRRMAPDDAEARFGLGQVWRQDWLKYLEDSSLLASIEQFRAAARLSPRKSDAWIVTVPLLLESRDLPGAVEAARAALAAEPGRPDAILADACVSYRSGLLARADSGFRRAIPRLPKAIRTRFEDIRPVASASDTLTLRQLFPGQSAAFTRKFWRQQDPDLASRENEALLEFWSRVAHAYLLYYDARRQAWDERGEIYVRYGEPTRRIYNGVGKSLNLPLTPGARYPMNVLVWEYAELGMRVAMQDRMLNGFYYPELNIGLIQATTSDPQPDPDSLARRLELMDVGGGRGVFRRVPPGSHVIPVEGSVARFEAERGTRLLAGFEVSASPGDSLRATWVVRDSNDFELARATRGLSPSACAPTESQVAEFAADLAPGRYLVGVSIEGPGGARGLYRERLEVTAADSGLTLSDLVVSCGVPDASSIDPANPAVRIEPNPSARVREGQPLTAYFEIGHLRADAEGLARFELEYQVRSIERDSRVWVQRLFAPRPVPQPLVTSRTEQQAGSLRRQFVSVPLQSMPPGRFRLEVRVRDLVSGRSRSVFTDFVHGTAGGARRAGQRGAVTGGGEGRGAAAR